MKFVFIMFTAYFVFFVILLAISLIVYKQLKLTFAGTLTGGIVTVGIFMGAAMPGVLMLAAFFMMATLATSWKKNQKGKAHPEIRNAAQVLANGGLAGFLGLLLFLMPTLHNMILVLLAAALSSATADTLSSELGMVYGKRFYNIISFKPDERGRDGVISLEGTLIGIAGSAIIALIYLLFFGSGKGFWLVIAAGTAGNLFDSVLGATMERRGRLKNNAVNFLNTLFAVLIAYSLLSI